MRVESVTVMDTFEFCPQVQVGFSLFGFIAGPMIEVARRLLGSGELRSRQAQVIGVERKRAPTLARRRLIRPLRLLCSQRAGERGCLPRTPARF